MRSAETLMRQDEGSWPKNEKTIWIFFHRNVGWIAAPHEFRLLASHQKCPRISSPPVFGQGLHSQSLPFYLPVPQVHIARPVAQRRRPSGRRGFVEAIEVVGWRSPEEDWTIWTILKWSSMITSRNVKRPLLLQSYFNFIGEWLCIMLQ